MIDAIDDGDWPNCSSQALGRRRPQPPPRAAAVAGVVFSLLTLTSFGLLSIAIPRRSTGVGWWLTADTGEVALALDLIPFAGIAFLWFIGVIRDGSGLGRREVAFLRPCFWEAASCS